MTKSQRLTNSAGSVVSTVELDPWGGETSRSSNQALQPHRYTSYERDANGGDEAMMRRYESQWQRFAQPDPYDGSYDLSNPQSFNRYGYVQNDPVNFVDPSGLGDEPIDDIIIINVQDDVLVINHSEPNLSAYYAFLRESQRLFWNSMRRQAGEDVGGLRSGGLGGSQQNPQQEPRRTKTPTDPRQWRAQQLQECLKRVESWYKGIRRISDDEFASDMTFGGYFLKH